MPHLSKAPAPFFPQTPWAQPWEEIIRELRVSPESGLTQSEIPQLRKRYDPNLLRKTKTVSAWDIWVNQFKNLIVVFLVAAALLSFAFGEHVEGIAIGMVIVINAVIGFVTEIKGVRSVEALRQLGRVHCRVRRDGQAQEISAEQLLPGDIVLLEVGDVITADLRIITSSKLEADESVLTGESLPVTKNPLELPPDTPLAERSNMLFKGTALSRGSGEGVVVGTGMHTELGTISQLVAETEDETTPLEKRLNQLGHWLVWASLGIGFLVALSGILTGKDVFLMIETAIALAVASIPEGLPIVATIALARGVWRMARHNALIKELSAVETLGATSIICTDKTGTLTENKLTLTTLFLPDGRVTVPQDPATPFLLGLIPLTPETHPQLRAGLMIGALCNNASLSRNSQSGKPVGDPLEVALLEGAAKGGLHLPELLAQMPEAREEAFDPTAMMMATLHRQEDGFLVAVKGSPEAVLEVCTTVMEDGKAAPFTAAAKDEWLRRNEALASQGLRVLALASGRTQNVAANPYENLQLVGLAGFLDPPRADVKEALALCRQAGIRVVMVTGDQPVTARIIGKAVGLTEQDDAPVMIGKELKHVPHLTAMEKSRILATPLFARVSPQQKLDLIEVHQQAGAIVAMTGDGVNDAPALKKADIGIAMGKHGTEVAREAADMILKDDAFGTIVHAIEQGRIIFNNIRKFVLYLLSCNLSEMFAVTLAAIFILPLPILPLQILFLNIVTDVFPALALAAGESNPTIMTNPPRNKSEPIMTRSHWLLVLAYGLLIALSVLGALALAQNWLAMDTQQAVTVSFLTLAFAQIWHVLNMRDHGASFFNNVITRNPFIWGAAALCSAMLVATIYLPGLSDILKVSDPGLKGWGLVLMMSVVPVLAGVPISMLLAKRRPGTMKQP
ncbi:cation-translocating P-type ATPase [Thiovibrio frasassiensis]|uniref:Cation-transporting P-type ATPase n=1 Tax=Thiovibrio frasassiensis TaxID=2984131 RepID=A0A9X4MJ92_9BACT|nr:cation-transporting P-type ATPase [Thiovibrio frasassiensis]MDG4476518.1 cation-transporting P-type ATPase [Thiovibrio frasassiensis]